MCVLHQEIMGIGCERENTTQNQKFTRAPVGKSDISAKWKLSSQDWLLNLNINI